MIPGIHRVCGREVESACQRFYLERGRGHSKTTDIAVVATTILYSSPHKVDGVVVGADKDQAGLTRNAIDRLIRLSPWLSEYLEVQANKVINTHTGSTFTIIAADVAGSWGLLIDFAICDEITHWPKRDLWDSIFSAVAKRKNALLLVIANAGFKDHWAWDLRNAVMNDPDWHFHRLDGAIASWISKPILAEQYRLLPAKEADRLWGNNWQSSGGSVIPHIEEAIVLKGPSGPHRDKIFVAGLDLGITHDHSAFEILAQTVHGDYRCGQWHVMGPG